MKADSADGVEITRVLLKDVDKRRYTPTQIVEIMQAEGFPKFRLQNHTELWQALDARDPAKRFGKAGLYRNTWEWFDSWVARVRAHCQENAPRYA